MSDLDAVLGCVGFVFVMSGFASPILVQCLDLGDPALADGRGGTLPGRNGAGSGLASAKPAKPRLARWFAVLMQALHDSRKLAASREIGRFRHLISD